MILAAGRGERMRPLTDNVPKPLLPVAGRALIVHHLERLAAAGFTDIVVNLSWLGEQIRAAIGDGAHYGVRLHYSDEGPVALETGGGLHRALPLLGDGPFLAVNGDILSDYPYARLARQRPAAAHLVLVPNPAQHPRGDFALHGNEVRRGGDSLLTFSGIAVYDPRLFAHQRPGRFSIVPLLEAAMARGEVSGELYDGQWFDIGTPQRLAEIDRLLAAEPAAGRPNETS